MPRDKNEVFAVLPSMRKTDYVQIVNPLFSDKTVSEKTANKYSISSFLLGGDGPESKVSENFVGSSEATHTVTQ